MQPSESLLGRMTRNWWSFVLRGIAAILLGLAALLWPRPTVFAVVILFGVYAISDGVVAIVGALRGSPTRWGLLVWGALSVVAGAVAFLWPRVTAVALLYVIAAWGVATGIAQISTAVALRKEMEGEWMLALSGTMTILFGILLILSPEAGVLSLTWLIGAYALLFGVMLVFLGLRLRAWRSEGSLSSGFSDESASYRPRR